MNDPNKRQLFQIQNALKSAAAKLQSIPDELASQQSQAERNKAIGQSQAERNKAIGQLHFAHAVLEKSQREAYDLATRHLFPKLTAAHAKMLREHEIYMLSQLGSKTIVEIRESLSKAGLPCPLAVLAFHEEYQSLARPPRQERSETDGNTTI